MQARRTSALIRSYHGYDTWSNALGTLCLELDVDMVPQLKHEARFVMLRNAGNSR